MQSSTVKTTQVILGIPISILSSDEVLTLCLEAHKDQKRLFITTPNPEILVRSFRDKQYRQRIKQANFALPDGIGIVLVLRLLYGISITRCPGVVFMEKLCERAPQHGLKIFLLGGRDGVNARCATKLIKAYPQLKISGSYEGDSLTAIESLPPKIQQAIKEADIVFVAFGAPHQEVWIERELPFCKKGAIAMGVGGSFDIIAGDKPRAPYWIQRLGGEWIYRLWLEPWRWRRMLALPYFVLLAICEKLGFLEKDF